MGYWPGIKIVQFYKLAKCINEDKITQSQRPIGHNPHLNVQLRRIYMASEKIFECIFFPPKNLALQLPWPPIKISDLDKIHMVVRGLTPETFQLNFGQNICSNTEINANFHFFQYKYMETLSCHSNESTRATTIKNIIYVEANVMNIYVKFQLHPPYGF